MAANFEYVSEWLNLNTKFRVYPTFAISINTQPLNLRKSRDLKSHLKFGLTRLGCTLNFPVLTRLKEVVIKNITLRKMRMLQLKYMQRILSYLTILSRAKIIYNCS